MNDANTAALRRHEREEAAGEARHDAYGDRVIEGIVDELFTTRGKIAGLTLHDFCEEALTFEDMGILLLARNRDDQNARLDAMKKKVEAKIREWCEGRGAEYIDERVREWDADDRADARRSVSEAV